MKKNLLVLLTVLCLLFAAACLAEEENQVDVTLEGYMEAGGMLYVTWTDDAYETGGLGMIGTPGQTIGDMLQNNGVLSVEPALLTFVKEQSDVIKTSLEQEPLTQTDMNQKSEELRVLWDEALNLLLEESKKILPEAEVEKLTAEQSAWQADTEAAVKAAGKEFEGGSLYPLTVNTEAAKLTEERVYKLYELLK